MELSSSDCVLRRHYPIAGTIPGMIDEPAPNPDVETHSGATGATDPGDSTGQEAAAHRRQRTIRRRRRRIAGLSLAGLGAVILLAGGWVAWRTYQAYTHLQAASDQVSQLQAEIKDITAIDLTATDRTVASLQSDAAKADSAVSDPLFRLASHLPWVGPNLHAVSEVAGTVNSLSVDVLPSLVQIARTITPAALAPKNGAIDLAPIEAAAPLLQKADAAVNTSRVRLAAINRSALVKQVNDAVLKLWAKLDQASSVTATGARVTRLLPPMLGAAGPRTYLLAFQNLAEVRATGGIFGSYATVRVDHGLITVVDRGRSSNEFGYFQPPIQTFDAKITNLYSKLLGVYPQDVNLRPDFPTAAAIYAKMYTARKGTVIDGVIATDPVALSYAMTGMSPIDVGDGVSLTSDNIVSMLLSTAYAKFPDFEDQSRRDDFLANATTVAFTRVLSGSSNAASMFSGLKQAAAERRVLLWSANATEQADIMQTGLAGSLSERAGDPSIGVFLNDGTGAKLDYYLNNSVRIVPATCHPDGRRELRAQITLSYDAPKTGLPAYVLGSSAIGLKYGLETNVLVFAPVGGGVVSATRDGSPVPFQRGEDRSREVAQVTITLMPGTSTVLDVTLLAPAGPNAIGQAMTPTLVLTPGVQPWTIANAAYEGCKTS